ncbi:MAG: hypothetical protein HY842_12275 [Bacteroidetes bacterium]|nr:hypothetical protein [Bacteroidota bacterium]
MPPTSGKSFPHQKFEILKRILNKNWKEQLRLFSPAKLFAAKTNTALFFAPENCTNGIDDDGDGFVDDADPDCGCSQTIMLVARDNGQILRVNLTTGGSTSVAASSPYVTGNLNAMGANADNNLVYYCSGKNVYYWEPSTGTHGLVVDLTGKIGSNESLSSGGGEYYGGYIYLGTENGNPGTSPKIWKQQLSANGKSFVGNPVNLNAPIPTSTSWGDMIATPEGGQLMIYGMTAASKSYFWKFNTATIAYTTIRNDLPTEMQIGVDIDGNTWAGSLSSGMIQKISRTTGLFYGSIISFGGKIWDLTGPINCPQSVEICGNGIDDDGDELIDNQDQDCLCPVITPNDAATRTICEGDMVSFNVTSNAPNPPYTYLEFYRFATAQTNPYLSTDAKTWLGQIANTTGSGTISTSNFPNSTVSDQTYYVYGLVKPAPQFPATCAPLAQYVVTVKPAATADAGADVSICNGTTTTLQANGTNAPQPLTYTWNNGLGSGNSKVVSPTSTTTYTVTVTAGNGCTSTDQVTVSVNPSPTVDAGANVAICKPGTATLTATALSGVGPFTYQWSNSLGSGATKVVSPTLTTTYTVTITSSNGCAGTDQVTVTVNTCVENCMNGIDDDGDGAIDCFDSNCSLTVTAPGNFSICSGQQVSFTASAVGGSGSYSYAWSNGLGSGASQTVSPTVSTLYTVTVTATSGCTGTATVNVEVLYCPENCSNGIDDDYDGLVDCDDPDCAQAGMPQLVSDSYTTCPGLLFTERVTYNDGNLQDPAFSIFVQPSDGSVIIDGTGKFIYTPYGTNCGVDFFVYQVCNQATGCCAQAAVTIHLGDTTPPTLQNVPADLTIGCDDEVPSPSQVLAYDGCPGIYMDFDEITNQYSAGACETYTITRTWTATDLCGNTSSDNQVITIQDLTAPEVFRVYTLPNGKRLTAGVAQRVTGNWKYVSFPVTFGGVPVVFGQLTAEAESQAATVQLRNISTQGFEVKIAEQEVSNGEHLPESVAWLAIQPGATTTTTFGLDAGTLPNVTSALQTLNFGLSFSGIPALVATLQTTNEADVATPRIQNLTGNNAQVFVDEESSKDAETTHGNEKLGYLAVTPGVDLTDERGDFWGETGVLNLTNAWATVTLRQQFTKPVVILGGISMNDGEPVTLRVKNVTPNSFQVRLQEWTYQDGTHGAESVGYVVLEGSIPADIGYYCEGKASNLVTGVNVFARDNCDSQLTFGFTESEEMLATGLRTTRTWAAIDDCGHVAVASRNDTCTIAAVKLKAILHGAFSGNGGTSLMRDDLRTKGLIPSTEPFSGLSGYQHKGKGGGETLLPSLLAVTGNDAIVDWVFVEIRDTSAAAPVLATTSALLQRDGDVVTANGNEVIFFQTLQEGEYLVSIRHRNHLGMMTDGPVYLTSLAPPTFDFTDMAMPVRGWNEAGKLVNGKRNLWAGDFNGDRRVIYQGPSNDIFYLFSRVLADPGNVTYLANYISTGYDRNDLNLDGNIIYQGPGNERATLLYNTVLAHPTNSTYLANFIAREMMP